MSIQPSFDPVCVKRDGAVTMLVRGETRDLGGFNVRRILPSAEPKMVGPFIFLDHMGPAELASGAGIDVRPHPHIGLATITYLFEGEIHHRDSLGYVQPIRPGAVNLMTAGRGIVHSERTGDEERARASKLHGMQSWLALPDDDQEMEPAFEHFAAAELPRVQYDGLSVTVIAGELEGVASPVGYRSQTLYLEALLEPDAALTLPEQYAERGAYVVDGGLEIDGCNVDAGSLAVLAQGPVALRAHQRSRVMVIGGEPVGERHIWWNLVSSSRERIERAKDDWRNGRFPKIPGEVEFIPLPDDA